jgi:hypothetical protein
MAIFNSQSTRGGATRLAFPDFVADKTYCLTADGRVVEEGDPATAYLLVRKGAKLPYWKALQHGLISPPEEPKPLEAEIQIKAELAPPSVKANKGKA